MNERIKDKIEDIERYISELYENIPLNLDIEDYKKDIKTKAICERYFEKIVEAIIDIVFLMIKEKKLKIPEDEESSFKILSQNNIISIELAKKLIDAKGMRNIIVHEYGTIDDEKIFHAIYKELEKDTKEFIKSIELSLK
jgi:uncharacterized protein YutE (UPF0331/DUF86 family)